MVNTVRTTISVPRKVKERMDSAKGVNWSAVATQAFEAKLLELESTMEVNTVEEAVVRLKAAAAAEENRQRQRGKGAGREWAMGTATPRQLRRLAAYDFSDSSCSGWDDLISIWGNEHNDGVGHGLYWLLHAKGDADRETVEKFWGDVLGDDSIADHDFALGFVEGALEFWESVESRV